MGGRGWASPRSVLGAAVDVGAVLQQHLDNLGPTSRGRLVEGRVTGIVTPINLPDVLLQAVLNHVLRHREKKKN